MGEMQQRGAANRVRVRPVLTTLLCFMLVPSHALASPQLCPVWLGATLPQGPEAHLPAHEANLIISADDLNGSLDGISRFSGRVLLFQGPRTLETEVLTYYSDGNSVRAEGRVEYGDGNIEVSSRGASLELDPDRLLFEDVEYRLLTRQAQGHARSLEAERVGLVRLEGVRFTTCPPGDDSWTLHAPSIVLDTAEGVGTGRNVRLTFKGVPIFYTPWISFPLNDDRKSGFLAPEFGNSRRSGLEIGFPWYWNIAPDKDATITPRHIARHGFQLLTEYRYLHPGSFGTVETDIVPDDRVLGSRRGRFSWVHLATPARGWQIRVDFNHASDPDYFVDFGNELSATTLTHQRRMAEVSYHDTRQSFIGRLDGYQTLDRDIPPLSRPYARLPQLLWYGNLPGPGGLHGTLASELVRFSDDDRVAGERLDIQPAVEWRIGSAGWHLVPRASFRHTRYSLHDVLPGQDDAPSRSLPSLSLDGGLAFERPLSSGRIQTLEPRLYYLRIPHRDQTALPLFDTSQPEFNIIRLFRDNRFNGADRVGDANQLSFGIISRIHDPAGVEQLAFQLGRIRHFDDRRVTLPGEPVDTRDWSDVIAEAHARIRRNWSARLGLQWDPDAGKIARSAALLRWHPGDERQVSVGWRFRRNQVDQADLGFAWPLSERWGIVGRWNYSFEDRTNIETVVGVEYRSCCWALQLVSREYIATRNGELNRSIYLQLELKGLMNLGRRTEASLDRGILTD